MISLESDEMTCLVTKWQLNFNFLDVSASQEVQNSQTDKQTDKQADT